MSHIAVYKTTLGNVNVDILKKALEVLGLEETGLEMRDYVEDYYGKKHTLWEGNKIIAAIFSKNLRKGLGMYVDKNDHLVFVSHDFGPALDKMKAKVEQTYKLVSLIMALQNMGYEITFPDENKMTAFEASSGRQKITASMDDKGKLNTDLDGFAGKTCYEEAIKLAEELKELGVNVDAQEQQPKTEERQVETHKKQAQRE